MRKFRPSEGYRYEKLTSKRTVRLLDLKPSSTFSDEICCDLRQAHLDDEEPFEALSYTWGDGKDSRQIRCNGSPLPIRPSLETALRFIRSKDETRTFWIDAICINQQDTPEREKQVSLMRYIFSRAWQVLAWIGEEDIADSPALNIEKLQHKQIDTDDQFVKEKIDNYITELLRTMMSAMTLLRRPWFSRTWIIQEVALSNKLLMQCSHRVIKWSSFLALLRLLPLVTDKEGTQIYVREVFLERAQFVASTKDRIAERRLSSTKPQSNVWQELQSIVSQARPFGATSESDRIFALLGLVDQKVEKVFVDYGSPYRQIYREFTRLMISATGSLAILGHADSQLDEKFESWVPNWTIAPSVDALSSLDRPYYSAAGDSSVEVASLDDTNVLALYGIFLDTIVKIKAGPTTDEMEALNKGERLIARGTKFGLPESTPLLPYKSVGHVIPKASDPEDEAPQSPSSQHTIPRKPVSSPSSPTEEKSINDMANLSLTSTRSSQDTLISFGPTLTGSGSGETITTILARGVFTGLTRDPRVRHNHYIWGSIHPTNGVYLKASHEASWKESLPKDEQYPTGQPIEEAYWRTLTGDKRTPVSHIANEPPPFWQHAYRIWQTMLWERAGHIKRFTKEAGYRILGRGDVDASLSLAQYKSLQNQQLRDYFQSENAKRERDNRASQLQVPAFRNILSVLIKIHDKARPGDELALGYSNTDLISNLDNFDTLSPQAAAHLEHSLAALPTSPLSDDELRNHIDKAFWYDFLRVARNRQFCVTKKGYIGWAPTASEKGDRICLLKGGQVPYVVRPHRKKKGEWTFLGEAYVHGLMKGEAMKDGKLEMETIRLR